MEGIMKTTCHMCKSDNWLPLPDPVDFQSVTTSGIVVPQPLGKSICLRCGLVQRVRVSFLGRTPYYEKDYSGYYDQPGTEEFHKKRYQQLVNWMSDYLLKEFNFRTVLDVGCGQGWAMDAMLSKFENINICGIEPSKHNSAISQKKGYQVFKGKIEDLNINNKYDLIYSNNVIQHVNDPKKFVLNIKKLLNKEGAIIITCPDSSKPQIELLFSDHNYSFLPANLVELGNDLNFNTLLWSPSAENPSLPPAQLLLLTDNGNYAGKVMQENINYTHHIKLISTMKSEYLNSLKNLRNFLMENISGNLHVYNFGASFWTSVLSAYCPDYWDKVQACLVDRKNNANEFMGKKILELKDIENIENSIIVLGTNPATHEFLINKLKNDKKIVRWDAFFKY
jgi:SAM-dependent methyltransferase